MSLKTTIRDMLPLSTVYWLKGLRQEAQLVASTLADYRRFRRWSSVKGQPRTHNQVSSALTMDYHRLEKGLSLKTPRPGFGKDVVDRMLFNLKAYKSTDLALRASVNSLAEWLSFSKGKGSHPSEQTESAIHGLSDKFKGQWKNEANCTVGGTIDVTRKEVRAAALDNDFESFFKSRHSIRTFAETPVDMKAVAKAVDLARKTPSVCNRQCWRVHAFNEPVLRSKLLGLQNGNRGFNTIDTVLLVTADLQAFVSAGERYQGWIDGGMFSMSLVLALHAQGLGSCCLNWSTTSAVDKKLRKAINLPPNELVIMMIAVGNLPDKFKVASSPRTPTADILTVNSQPASKKLLG